jgi:outer membrane lipoprotein-sorting protein
MMRFFKRIFPILLLCVLSSSVDQGPSQARVIVDDMVRAMGNVITLSGKISRNERFKGSMENGELRFKLNSKPRKIYIYNLRPDAGAEVLYAEGWNNEKAYIHPNKFPWINVSLSVNSGELLKNNHHNMLAIGFDYTLGIVKHMLAKYGKDFDKYVKYDGKKKWYDKTLDVIKITYNDYKFENYTVLAGEDLFKIDAKLKIPAYKIIELNPEVEDFFDVKAGQVIKVPNEYAKEMIVMVDPVSHLPLVQAIFDEKGLFEKYEYSEVKVNPRFTTMEFSEDNEAYGF